MQLVLNLLYLLPRKRKIIINPKYKIMEKPYVVGIDIGGTNTVFGVVDARGTILYSGSIKTGKYADVNDYVAELAKGLKSVIDQAGGPDKIKGVGVGAPNGNFFNGCIEFAPNLPWKGKIPLAQLISEQIDGIPDAAMKNDKIALEIFEATGSMLGEAFADFVAFSSPEAIILFGGLTKAGDLIMNPIKRSMEKNMLKVYAGKTKLLFSQLKESDAAVLGASALGWEVRDQSAGLEV